MFVYAFDMDRTLAMPNGTSDPLSYTPIQPIVSLARSFQDSLWGIFVVTTARPDTLREKTETWLNDHGLNPVEILMRENGDYREDHHVRVDQIQLLKEKYGNNVFLYDDKITNCRAVEYSLGIPCVIVRA
jgi:hypothetical protein